jgi:hypothetical protein
MALRAFVGNFVGADHQGLIIMKKVLLKNTIGFAVAVASTQLFAAGFALNEQSISGMGTGFAGRSSSADDASTYLVTQPVWHALSGNK